MSLSVCLYNTGPGQGGTCISDKFSSNRSQFKSGSQTRGFYDEYLSGMLAATRCRVLRSNVQQKRNLNGPADGPVKRTVRCGRDLLFCRLSQICTVDIHLFHSISFPLSPQPRIQLRRAAVRRPPFCPSYIPTDFRTRSESGCFNFG
jgi:hypothetical protein